MTTGEAVRAVLRWLLATIRANEEGVLRGEDPETLHDFRVAVRRSRTLLSELSCALPKRPTDHFRAELKWLGRCSGPVRDLDVWIARQPGYRGHLPERTRSDLSVFESRLRLRRDRERARLVRALRSGRYASLLEDWEEFLWRPASDGGSPDTGDRPVLHVASQRIWKAYRRALKQGGKIVPGSPPAEIHKLRIRCKKLRYLLEFFGTLYESEAILESIGALKRLQDHLGDFNDVAVQRRLLSEFAREIAADGGKDAAGSVRALERLEVVLAASQREERKRIERRFAGFQREGNRRLFRELFASA